MGGQYRSGVLADRLEPDAALAFEGAAAAAADRWGEGAVDDLVLLRTLLERADDDLLKVLGSHLKRVLDELATVARTPAEDDPGRRVPYGEHLLEAALNEAIDLTGQADEITGLHLVLALFFFPGARAAEALQRCGIDWRPLRSLARHLTGISSYDW
jgi:hypothetical protein